MIFELEKDLMVFPHPELPELDDPSGFVAIGGDLSVERLLLAYDYGFFPWYAFKDKDIHWYCPRQRFVIFPGEVHVSHSMRTLMNKNLYRVTFDAAFDQAIRGCSTVDNRINQIGAWLGDDIIAAYSKLHTWGVRIAWRCGVARSLWAASMVWKVALASWARACSRASQTLASWR